MRRVSRMNPGLVAEKSTVNEHRAEFRHLFALSSQFQIRDAFHLPDVCPAPWQLLR